MTPHESYHDRIRDSKNPRAIRPAMVEFSIPGLLSLDPVWFGTGRARTG